MQKSKGKQATRGLKQILDENAQTVNFYFNVLAISNVSYLMLRFALFWNSFTLKFIILFAMLSLFTWIAFYIMKSMAKPTLDENGSVLDAADLNMPGHVSEYFKDIILFSPIVYSTSLISNYFWLLLLVYPGYAFYLAWKNFLGPWFFAPAPEDPSSGADQSDKKVKEKRKMIRVRQ